MNEKDTKLLTEKEAADYFGWSLYTMREIRKRGEIEFIQFSEQTIRYTPEMLENYQNRYLKQAA
jgi:Helix-turn-helix domain